MEDQKNKIIRELFDLRDLNYKAFHMRLVPNIDADTIIGVRLPTLRTFVKKNREILEDICFVEKVPYAYYEENMIHAILISGTSDYDECLRKLEAFLPYIDNWGVCDSLRPAVFAKNKQKLKFEALKWIRSDKEYTERFGIEMLMTHFLDDEFEERFLNDVSSVKSDRYYVQMMQAWYFATALCKKYGETVKVLENNALSDFVHNKTIQKANESYRISKDKKEYLKTLKRTNKK